MTSIPCLTFRNYRSIIPETRGLDGICRTIVLKLRKNRGKGLTFPRSKDESRSVRFKVIKEDDNWKILLRKAWEEEEEFLKALLAEKK